MIRLATGLIAIWLTAVAPTVWAQSIVRAPQSVSVGRTDPHWYIDATSVDVAADRDGTVLLTWSEWRTDGAGLAVTQAAYKPTNFALLPPATRTLVETSYARPRAAASVDGGFLATWMDLVGTASTLLDRVLDRRGATLKDDAVTAVEPGEPFVYIGSHAIAGLPSALYALAWRDSNGFKFRLVDRNGLPFSNVLFLDGQQPDPRARIDVVAASDGGVVVAWQPPGGDGPTARHLDASGQLVGDAFTLSSEPHLHALASSPAGNVLAALLVRGAASPEESRELWVVRFTSAGTTLGPEILVQTTTEPFITGDLDFDVNGNLYVVWAEGSARTKARGYDTSGNPLGPPIVVDASRGNAVRTARNSDGNFVNINGTNLTVSVASLCTPGTSVCGDGVLDPICERCDDGAANSDVTPDACRTTCRLPRCGDGVVDGGEGCDDGNRDDCDGCSYGCQPEIGLGCGDGIAFPSCGETCDDNNFVVGDGCAPGCKLERIPGGGAGKTDCYTEWSVDNPVNVPLLDKSGRINGVQTCKDNDSACDHDGGTAGSCSFALKVCVNNTDGAANCTPSSRLASWDLMVPSASKAATDPTAAAVRAAFAGVPGTILGPTTRDLCTPALLVPVPLKASGQAGKLKLKTRGQLYGKAHDQDALRLICLP